MRCRAIKLRRISSCQPPCQPARHLPAAEIIWISVAAIGVRVGVLLLIPVGRNDFLVPGGVRISVLLLIPIRIWVSVLLLIPVGVRVGVLLLIPVGVRVSVLVR